MMRAACISLWLVVCLGAGCGTGSRGLGSAGEVSIAPLFGTSLNAIAIEQSGESLSLRFAPLSKTGSYFALTLPAGTEIAGETWSNEANAVHLLVETEEGAELGVVPTPSYTGGELIARFKLAPRSPGKQASTAGPPDGPQNAVKDLTVVQVAPGKVQLEWTEVNVGDYDLNGQVGISDLTPLGANFGQSGFTPGDPLTVIDGDGNGALNISDITPIGVNFGHFLNGYLVRRNGVAVLNGAGGLPSVIRGSPSPGSGHPRYSLSADGTTADEWIVIPVDGENNEGQPSSGSQSQEYDASVGLSISGADLLLTDGSGSSAFGPGTSILRIIEDGDFPYHWDPGLWVGSVFEASYGSYFMNDVPRGVPLLLDICYAPTIDLETGLIKGSSSARGTSNLSQSDYVISSIPFVLQAGTTPSFGVNIEMVPKGGEDTGYYVYMTYGINGQSAPVSGHLRLDYPGSLVVSDNYKDGLWDNNPELTDTDRDFLSDAFNQRHKDNLDYGPANIKSQPVRGTISSIDIAAGLIVLNPADLWSTDPPSPGWGPAPPPGSIAVRFTELARIGEHNDVTGLNPPIAPTMLGQGDQVTIILCWEYTLPPSGPIKYWADEIVKGWFDP